jgi:hypothetical protein
VLSEPPLVIGVISTNVGVWLKTLGVKLFRGIVGGGVVPIGLTVISGVTTLIIVPGVVAGMVVLLAGINKIGIAISVGRAVPSTTLPIPETVSVIVRFISPIMLTPAPMRLTGPKQISPVS